MLSTSGRCSLPWRRPERNSPLPAASGYSDFDSVSGAQHRDYISSRQHGYEPDRSGVHDPHAHSIEVTILDGEIYYNDKMKPPRASAIRLRRAHAEPDNERPERSTLSQDRIDVTAAVLPRLPCSIETVRVRLGRSHDAFDPRNTFL